MSIKVKLRRPLFEGAPGVQGNTQQQTTAPANNANGQAATPAPAAQAATANQQQEAPKAPETKPTTNTQDWANMDQVTLINTCLKELVGLLVRPDAGGAYLKAISEAKGATQELKAAAQKFSAIKQEDTPAIINEFTVFANTCSAELKKMQQQGQQQQGQQQQGQQGANQQATPQNGQQSNAQNANTQPQQ